MCNNKLFNHETIEHMHETMVRLYEIAEKAEQIRGPSALAARLNFSPQRIKNWEYRGVSEAGAIQAQKLFGCDVNMLLGRTDTFQTSSSNSSRHVVEQLRPASWSWPFLEVKPDQWALLNDEEKKHIEDGILLCVKNRGDPAKQLLPAKNIYGSASA